MLIVPKPQLTTAKGIVGERKIETETFQKHTFPTFIPVIGCGTMLPKRYLTFTGHLSLQLSCDTFNKHVRGVNVHMPCQIVLFLLF